MLHIKIISSIGAYLLRGAIIINQNIIESVTPVGIFCKNVKF